MANKGFNGSTVTWPSGSAIGQLRGISFSETAAEVLVSSSTAIQHAVVNGKKKLSATIDLVGGSTVQPQDVGTLALTWFDGKTATIGTAVCVGSDIKGSMDGEITTSLKFAKST